VGVGGGCVCVCVFVCEGTELYTRLHLQGLHKFSLLPLSFTIVCLSHTTLQCLGVPGYASSNFL